MLDKIKSLYTESIQMQISASSLLPDKIEKASEYIVECLLAGNKVIVCGHGKAYANAQLFTANLLNRYQLARPSFPTVLLSLDTAVGSAIIADNDINSIYQRQFNAVAQPNDLLIIFSLFGNDDCILNLLGIALEKNIRVIALTSSDNQRISGRLTENDLEIAVPHNKESLILEQHLFILNTICELIEQAIFSR